MRRALFGVFLLISSLSAFGQPVVWQHTVDYTSFPKITRDPTGSIYFVTRESAFGTRILRVQKINPLGVVLWNKVVHQHIGGDPDEQYNIRRVIYAHDKVYILYQRRLDGGSGAHVQSLIRKVDPLDGTADSVFGSSIEFEGMAASNTGIVVSGFVGNDARFFRINLNDVATTSLQMSVYSGVADVACLPDGTSFIAANRSGGTVAIIKVNPDDSVTTYDLDNAARTDERMNQIVLDTAANRVYALGSGYYNGVQTDLDLTLYAMNMDGTNQVTGGAGGSTLEYPGAISVIPNNGIIISYFSDSQTPDATTVRRLSSTLTQTWTSHIYDATQGSGRSHAFDADGNLLVLDPAFVSGNTYVRVTKKAVSNGATLLTTLHPLFVPVTLELLSDAAGNYFCTVNQGYGAFLFRLQPAGMIFSANTVPGGGTITATIKLASPALDNQTWTLASANPSAASVPTNVTVNNGNNTATFDITTNPVTTNTNVGISARYQGFIMQKTLTLLTPTVSALSISPNVVIGGVNTAGLVTISGAAPTGGKIVTLASSNNAAATVPGSVLIPAGSTSFGFGITTFGVTANRGVVITATTGAISKTAFFAVNAPSLQGVAMNPTSIKGGLQSAMTVTLDGIAPTGGRSVVIFSGAPAIVFAPASVTVAAGQASITQNLTTAPVTSSTNVLIFATRSGIYKTATLTVTP